MFWGDERWREAEHVRKKQTRRRSRRVLRFIMRWLARHRCNRPEVREAVTQQLQQHVFWNVCDMVLNITGPTRDLAIIEISIYLIGVTDGAPL